MPDAYTGISFRPRKEGETEEEYQEAWSEWWQSRYQPSPKITTTADWAELLGKYNPVTQMEILEQMVGRGSLSPEEAASAAGAAGLTTGVYESARIEQEASAQRRKEALAVQEARGRRQPPEAERLAPASDLYYPFIEGLPSPAMQEYYRRNVPQQFYSQFGVERKNIALQEAERLRDIYGGKIERAERGVKEALTTLSQPGPIAERLMGVREARTTLEKMRAKGKSRAARVSKIREREDPFLSSLRAFPFAERYGRLSPGQRGEYTSRLRPPTRFLGF